MEGAETLAFLIQEDQELQKITSICDHSMKALAEYLSYTEIQQLDSRQTQKKVLGLFHENQNYKCRCRVNSVGKELVRTTMFYLLLNLHKK